MIDLIAGSQKNNLNIVQLESKLLETLTKLEETDPDFEKIKLTSVLRKSLEETFQGEISKTLKILAEE